MPRRGRRSATTACAGCRHPRAACCSPASYPEWAHLDFLPLPRRANLVWRHCEVSEPCDPSDRCTHFCAVGAAGKARCDELDPAAGDIARYAAIEYGVPAEVLQKFAEIPVESVIFGGACRNLGVYAAGPRPGLIEDVSRMVKIYYGHETGCLDCSQGWFGLQGCINVRPFGSNVSK